MKKQHSKNYFFEISVVAMTLAIFFVGGIFYWLYGSAKQNILNIWQNKNFHTAQDVGYYLTRPVDAVSFTALKINGMLARGATNEEISKYLIDESEIYSLVVEGNETGIYGYCQGEYLDSSGWTPPADYIPQNRPWYEAAVIADGNVALVEPYKNIQTFEIMMSVSQLLNDKKSVISMDIFLGNVQKILREISSNEDVVEMAMVMNKDGVVVAHSNEKEIGKNYTDENISEFGNLLTSEIKSEENIFTISYQKKSHIVFADKINDEWYMILVANERQMFSSIQYIYLFSALAMIIVVGAIFFGFYFMERKHSQAEKLEKEIKAVADIYAAMMMIDLKTDKIKVLRNNEKLDKLLGGDLENYSKRIISIMKQYSADQSQNLLMNFVDPATLEERLKNINSVSHEFLTRDNRWMRTRFIVVERDSNNKIKDIIFAFESIDEDRKHQEHLRELSEMDMMTKVRNRGSGEALIRKKMSDGEKGMFCLLDADKFKSINDNYGHSVGDKVIIAIADCLKKTFRDYDVIFRLGGDEFAVYACDVTDETIGRNILERLFHNLENIDIPELGDRKICVSVGCTFYPADRNDSFESLYERSDSGLYDSKKIEGNHVTFHLQVRS